MKIEIQNINKFYKKLHVLKDVNLTLQEGIYGLVGPNGAGKSTLMRLLVAAEGPASGEILFDGKNVHANLKEYKMKLGYLPQDFGFYKEFSGREMLRYTGLIKTDLSVDKIHAQTEELLEIMDLTKKADISIRKYSGGMKQRLGIAQAFLGYPDFVILDEATVGLDPMQRITFKAFLKEYSKHKTVLLSTHIMSDLQEIADDLIFIKEGQIVYDGTLEHEDNLETLYMKYFQS